VEAVNRYGKKHGYGNDRRRLNRLLKKAGISFEWHHLYDGYQWTFPNSAYPNGDAIIHFGSYGHNRGNFETMGIGPEDDCVERTAKELIELLVKHE
jgi:hypothetical protein